MLFLISGIIPPEKRTTNIYACWCLCDTNYILILSVGWVNIGREKINFPIRLGCLCTLLPVPLSDTHSQACDAFFLSWKFSTVFVLLNQIRRKHLNSYTATHYWAKCVPLFFVTECEEAIDFISMKKGSNNKQWDNKKSIETKSSQCDCFRLPIKEFSVDSLSLESVYRALSKRINLHFYFGILPSIYCNYKQMWDERVFNACEQALSSKNDEFHVNNLCCALLCAGCCCFYFSVS